MACYVYTHKDQNRAGSVFCFVLFRDTLWKQTELWKTRIQRVLLLLNTNVAENSWKSSTRMAEALTLCTNYQIQIIIFWQHCVQNLKKFIMLGNMKDKLEKDEQQQGEWIQLQWQTECITGQYEGPSWETDHNWEIAVWSLRADSNWTAHNQLTKNIASSFCSPLTNIKLFYMFILKEDGFKRDCSDVDIYIG